MVPVDPRALVDAELARAITAQADAARACEAELFRRFAPRVRLYGLRHLRSEHAADDLVQRVMVLTMQKLRDGAVREPERIGSFVLGTARTLSRQTRMGDRVEAPQADGPSHAAIEPDPLLRERLSDCVQALPERERTLVVLSFVQDSSSDEIGAALGMQPTHVRVARHRAIARLRDCLGLSDPQGP